MSGSSDLVENDTIMPPIGVILEVKYPGGTVGMAIWTGRSWRPRYLAMAPEQWRRRRRPEEAADDWMPCTDILR